MELSKQEMKITQKLDIDIFDDEFHTLRGAVNARVSTPATGQGEYINPISLKEKRGSQDSGKPVVEGTRLPSRQGGGGNARMSIADKTKLKDMAETLERVQSNQKTIQAKLRQITLDEFRQKQEEIEKELGLRCLKSDTDQKQVELMQNLTKNT